MNRSDLKLVLRRSFTYTECSMLAALFLWHNANGKVNKTRERNFISYKRRKKLITLMDRRFIVNTNSQRRCFTILYNLNISVVCAKPQCMLRTWRLCETHKHTFICPHKRLLVRINKKRTHWKDCINKQSH